MGSIKKAIPGGFSGKVGTVVGGRWKGIDFMRSVPVGNRATLGRIIDVFIPFGYRELRSDDNTFLSISVSNSCNNASRISCIRGWSPKSSSMISFDCIADNLYANAVDPGWFPTKMGGRSAPDHLQKGYETQVWLTGSNDEKAKVTGRYFFHQKESHYNPEADDVLLQERFLNLCKEITGISFPHV